ncbi:hypothetical protein PsorP6_002968 [Peronosclerospora sorghi]|uniref:Uncharacterized protein n=1 Tax=Peronosclerospora sorghi TaxID=230839 RepID=A0ACC0VMG2_9STRA|nr:hypothetical protein PsorP6_002968 [Peronosclerospora sorghi]
MEAKDCATDSRLFNYSDMIGILCQGERSVVNKCEGENPVEKKKFRRPQVTQQHTALKIQEDTAKFC